MKKPKLFGSNIKPDCSYCCNGLYDGESYVCSAGGTIKNGKCRRFYYNPTLRVPLKKQETAKLSPEDFKL